MAFDYGLNSEGLFGMLIFNPNSGTIPIQYMVYRPPPMSILPPTNLTGKQIINAYPFQSQRINKIAWSASPSPDVTTYNIYRNGLLLTTVPSNTPLYYYDLNIDWKEKYTYGVTAFNTKDEESVEVNIIL